MKILHTSDWHLGKTLGGRRRYDEFAAFLSWLIGLIREKEVTHLLLSGDVFDNTTPSSRAQELYYEFLVNARSAGCRHIVVTAGNHDSASLLDAPGLLLRPMNIHVIGNVSDAPADEVLLLKDEKGDPELVVCAVPYLPDRVLRISSAGESAEEKNKNQLQGLRDHYRSVCEYGRKLQWESGGKIPLVAMGHLYLSGSMLQEGDGVRELYIGTLLRIDREIFPEYVDYAALGHLHVPQSVDGIEKIRYSGSPLALGFGEANHEKSVTLVSFPDGKTVIEPCKVPQFRILQRISGNLEMILAAIHELKSQEQEMDLEITCSAERYEPGLNEKITAALEGTKLNLLILRTSLSASSGRGLQADMLEAELTEDEENVYKVFDRFLEERKVAEDRIDTLRSTYREAVVMMHETDGGAE
ncbi:MAG: exonuclease SbcCD subunit D C-terminal domain-containing protein [Lentisphaeria bacterium]|nr:exonuclease SbcCD subunit D C-terminal domain-containing protein [Lentisphaeria bacterium]